MASTRSSTRRSGTNVHSRKRITRPSAPVGDHPNPSSDSASQPLSPHGTSHPDHTTAPSVSGPTTPHPQLNPVHIYESSSNPNELFIARSFSPYTTPSNRHASSFSTPAGPPLESLTARLVANGAISDDTEDFEEENSDEESTDEEIDVRVGPSEVCTVHHLVPRLSLICCSTFTLSLLKHALTQLNGGSIIGLSFRFCLVLPVTFSPFRVSAFPQL
jgi:hypothetical protein